MAEHRLKWGIVGCGRISNDFVTAIQLLSPELHQVTCVSASNKEKAEDFARSHKLNDAKCYGSYTEMFADSNLEVVYVGLLNHMHKEIVLKALDSDKHVLCEKPLGLNGREVREMVEKARSKKRFLMEGFWSRFFPIWREIRTELDSGGLGDVKLVQCDFGISGLSESRMDVAKGGGVLVDIGCYALLLSLCAFGFEKPQFINAVGFKYPNLGVDCTGSVTLTFKGDRMAQFVCTGTVQTMCQAQICGTKGRLHIPHYFWCPDTLNKHYSEPVVKSETIQHPIPVAKEGSKFNFPNSGGLSYQAQCVRQCIVQGKTECPLMSLDESLMIADILEEIRGQLGVRYPQDEQTSS